MFVVDDIHGGSLLFIFSLLIHFAMRLLVSKTWRSKVPVKVQFWFIEQIHAFTRVVTGETLRGFSLTLIVAKLTNWFIPVNVHLETFIGVCLCEEK